MSLATLSSYVLGYPLTALLVLAGIAAAFFGWRWFILRGLVFWGNMVFWLVGRRLHPHGRKNIEEGKAYLILANHASMYDIPALVTIAPDMALVGREKLMHIPVFKRLLKVIRYIPIDTEKIRRAHDAIAEAVEKAASGCSIGMFPEGTRTPDGHVKRLKRGFVYVLRQSGLDVLPVTIRGTFALKPKGRFMMNPSRRVDIYVHRPVPNAELTALADEEIMEKVRGLLNDAKEARDEAR